MKHAIFLVVLIVMLTGIAYGDAYFDNQSLAALRVVQINSQEGTARVTAPGADSATVSVGDTIGQSAATITKISDLFVVVQTAQGKTKLPVRRAANLGGNCIIFQ